jgi:hypothetical protein
MAWQALRARDRITNTLMTNRIFFMIFSPL